MEDVIHYCRKCDWSGSEPKTKTWAGTVGHQGGGAPIGGNLSVCPKCQSSVKTEEEWYRHDNPTFLTDSEVLLFYSSAWEQSRSPSLHPFEDTNVFG